MLILVLIQAATLDQHHGGAGRGQAGGQAGARDGRG